MEDQWKQLAANYLNCSLLAIPFVYLGIPSGENPRRCQLWDPVINKCERKLAKWKQRHVFFGGRVTLIQSVLTSIPIYFFSFFRVPNRVVDKIVSLYINICVNIIFWVTVNYHVSFHLFRSVKTILYVYFSYNICYL